MKKLLFAAIAATLFFSCQTSKITHAWKEGNTFPKKYKKVLVLGVLTDNDRELKSKMEMHLVNDLKDLGYFAQSATEIFPPGTFVKGDTAKAAAAIQSKNYDAVLTVVLLNKTKEKYYVPGKVINTPYMYYHNRFDRYYDIIYQRIYSEGYYAEDTKIFWESNFYDVAEKKLVYSVQTSSFDPGSKETLAHYYGVLIANSLVKNKIIMRPDDPE